MNTFFDDVKDFFSKFGLDIPEKPRQLSKDEARFRGALMYEELTEYGEGYFNKRLEAQLDALVDLTYVVMGTAVAHGFDFNEAWGRVHRANMMKIRAEHESQSKRGSKLDVVKPKGWVAPDLSDLV